MTPKAAVSTDRRVRLEPFTYDQLHLAEPWFDNAETQQWLGGPSWLRQMLELADQPFGEFRGAIETGWYRWLAWDGDAVVGYIDCGTYDRWTTWDGHRVVATNPVPSGGIAYVVAPALRRQGYGSAMITALLTVPELAHIELFAAGIEPANAASVGCLLKAGFRPLDAKPDWEGIVYYALMPEPSRGYSRNQTGRWLVEPAEVAAAKTGTNTPPPQRWLLSQHGEVMVHSVYIERLGLLFVLAVVVRVLDR